jgi:TPR repeat protein
VKGIEMGDIEKEKKSINIDNINIHTDVFNSTMEHIESFMSTDTNKNIYIKGKRGTGKTFLLKQIKEYLLLKTEEDYNRKFVCIFINEELFGIRKAYKLLIKIAKAIYLQTGDKNIYTSIKDIEYKDEPEYINQIFMMIKDNFMGNKKIIIFVEEIFYILDNLPDKESLLLSKLLIKSKDILIISAGNSIGNKLSDSYKNNINYLNELSIYSLSKEEAVNLFIKKCINGNNKSLIRDYNKNYSIVEVYRRVTGGLLLHMSMFFDILNEHYSRRKTTFDYLNLLIDSLSLFYRERLYNISKQQQELIDVMALNWDAISVKELTNKTKLESKAISSQLRQLIKNGYVDNIATNTKNQLYIISERLLNIWYIIRYGSPDIINRLKWFIEFLEKWCNKTNFAEDITHEIETEYIEKISDKKGDEYFNLAMKYENENYDYKNARKFYIKSMKSGCELAAFNLGSIYKNVFQDYKKARLYYKQAVKMGDIDAIYNLALLDHKLLGLFDEAEKYYLMACKKGIKDAFYNIALLYKDEFKEYKKSEEYYLLAAKKGVFYAYNNLGNLYTDIYKDFKKQKSTIKQALCLVMRNLLII